MNFKSIKTFKSNEIQICYLKSRKFLVFNLNGLRYYKELPKETFVGKSSISSVNFYTKSTQKKVNENLTKFLNNIESSYRSKLVLKGLGLKVNFSADKKTLDFKLGYSHLCKIHMDKEIKIGLSKTNLYLNSPNKIKMGNFAFRIRKLRLPNPYKGKGIWYKNERMVLKEVKKK